MKTILILVPRFGVGGISKIGSFIANTLSVEYKVLFVSLIPDDISSTVSDNVIKKCLNYDFVHRSNNALLRLIKKVSTIIRLRYLIKKYRVNLICSLGLDLGNIALLTRIGLYCKCITSERGNPYRYTEKQKKKYDNVIKKSDCIIFQTKMAQEAFANCDITYKSFIIQNPAIGRNSKDYINKHKDKEKRIVYCGRLSPEKNIDMLISAFAKLRTEEYQLVIYGDGPEYSRLVNLICNEGISDKAEIIQGCNDVFSIESNSEIFVLTSNEEGMPNALIEAMMCGMTCIVTDCPPGGCRELLQDGKRGILVPVNGVDELANAIWTVISDPSLSHRYGEAAKTILQTNASEVIQNQWREVVGGVVGGNI